MLLLRTRDSVDRDAWVVNVAIPYSSGMLLLRYHQGTRGLPMVNVKVAIPYSSGMLLLHWSLAR